MAGWEELFSRDPQICGGGICASGTRIPITVILDSLAEGASKEEILASYPSLRVDHINASMAYLDLRGRLTVVGPNRIRFR